MCRTYTPAGALPVCKEDVCWVVEIFFPFTSNKASERTASEHSTTTSPAALQYATASELLVSGFTAVCSTLAKVSFSTRAKAYEFAPKECVTTALAPENVRWRTLLKLVAIGRAASLLCTCKASCCACAE